MANTYVAIASSTVGSTAVSTITFSDIPQTYTDLFILCSLRTDRGAAVADAPWVKFNGSATSPTNNRFFGSGTTVTSDTNAWTLANATSSTSNTFANNSFYIPNYTGSTNKSFSIDSAVENNAVEAYASLQAGLWSSTAAITSIEFNLAVTGRNFVQYSSITLYGIKKD